MVRTSAGVSELETPGRETFASLWTDDGAVTGGGSGTLLAISTDEVWFGTSRYVDGSWTDPLGIDASSEVDPGVLGSDPTQAVPSVLATDGAVWFVLPTGLTRVNGDDVSVVAEDVTSSGLAPGPDGSVWVVVDGDAVRVDQDGSRRSIGQPDSGELQCLLAGGGDGTLWAQTGCDGSSVPVLTRWDGNEWNAVDLPGPDAWIVAMTVTDDGTSWGAFLGNGADDPASGVGYYTDGSWQMTPGYPYTLAPAPGGRVCSADDSDESTPDTTDLLCYDTGGLVETHQMSWDTGSVSIAGDGAIWVAGGRVARLGETLAPTESGL